MDRQTHTLLSDLLIGHVLRVIGHLDESRQQALCRQAPGFRALLGMDGHWQQLAATVFGIPGEQLHARIRERWQAETGKAPSDPLRFAQDFVGDQLMRRWG